MVRILENTDMYRLDQITAMGPRGKSGYLLYDKINPAVLSFTDADQKKWTDAWEKDIKNHSNASLNQRFKRLWKKFEKSAQEIYEE